MSFEAWQEAAGVRGVLPTYEILRTASMWRECGGQPFEVPPFALWPGLTMTLRYIRDWVKPAVGEVDAVSGYRNPALNRCARGAERSAHVGYFALDLVPRVPLARRDLFRRLCAMHARSGNAFGAGLGFYTFQRFHIDTRSFRRWGSAGPRGNESPCAVIERGEDPLAGRDRFRATAARAPAAASAAATAAACSSTDSGGHAGDRDGRDARAAKRTAGAAAAARRGFKLLGGGRRTGQLLLPDRPLRAQRPDPARALLPAHPRAGRSRAGAGCRTPPPSPERVRRASERLGGR